MMGDQYSWSSWEEHQVSGNGLKRKHAKIVFFCNFRQFTGL